MWNFLLAAKLNVHDLQEISWIFKQVEMKLTETAAWCIVFHNTIAACSTLDILICPAIFKPRRTCWWAQVANSILSNGGRSSVDVKCWYFLRMGHVYVSWIIVRCASTARKQIGATEKPIQGSNKVMKIFFRNNDIKVIFLDLTHKNHAGRYDGSIVRVCMMGGKGCTRGLGAGGKFWYVGRMENSILRGLRGDIYTPYGWVTLLEFTLGGVFSLLNPYFTSLYREISPDT